LFNIARRKGGRGSDAGPSATIVNPLSRIEGLFKNKGNWNKIIVPEITPVQKQSPSVLVIGAGISGMAASLELYKADVPFVVVEKNDKIGGLCRTLQWGEFRTDIGPHIVGRSNTFIQDLLGKHLIAATDRTGLCYNGEIIHFFAVKEILSKVGPRILSKVLIDYSAETVKTHVRNRVPISLEEKLVSDFGRTLAELFLLDYVEKVWGLPCAAMSPDSDLISRLPPPL
jgi:protoporphyrinogen oxidase